MKRLKVARLRVPPLRGLAIPFLILLGLGLAYAGWLAWDYFNERPTVSVALISANLDRYWTVWFQADDPNQAKFSTDTSELTVRAPFYAPPHTPFHESTAGSGLADTTVVTTIHWTDTTLSHPLEGFVGDRVKLTSDGQFSAYLPISSGWMWTRPDAPGISLSSDSTTMSLDVFPHPSQNLYATVWRDGLPVTFQVTSGSAFVTGDTVLTVRNDENRYIWLELANPDTAILVIPNPLSVVFKGTVNQLVFEGVEGNAKIGRRTLSVAPADGLRFVSSSGLDLLVADGTITVQGDVNEADNRGSPLVTTHWDERWGWLDSYLVGIAIAGTVAVVGAVWLYIRKRPTR